MLTGINHITVAVDDLDKSFEFYVSVLGMKPEVKWEKGAYLSLGELWFCLSLGESSPAKDYSHIAFTIEKTHFDNYCGSLLSSGVKKWKENVSEGESFYILDPNGHKLEIHVGSLATRLKQLKTTPYRGLEWFYTRSV